MNVPFDAIERENHLRLYLSLLYQRVIASCVCVERSKKKKIILRTNKACVLQVSELPDLPRA